MLTFFTSDVTKPRSIWAMLDGAFVYRCAAIVVLGPTLALNAAAQSEVPTVKPKIKLVLKLSDLWIPTGGDCWWPNPAWNSTDGIFIVAVGNKGNASAPQCSLRIIEKWPVDPDSISGPWKTHKEYLATVPPLAPGEQKQIKVKVTKFTPSSDPQGDVHKPMKRARQWFFKADGKNQIPEVNEGNNGLEWKTFD
jgi:hypothetical protein